MAAASSIRSPIAVFVLATIVIVGGGSALAAATRPAVKAPAAASPLMTAGLDAADIRAEADAKALTQPEGRLAAR
ncbi:hypothetical protein [Rhodospirillum centenum]|uniref:Uncharacterized protein n=1 Tax=Rhodospirillum centenum (strain ATCC 51521 / SW) TaxID=414684 RepID=B6IWG2_RHOCS|nr:hypothetical protein [Rhodospirillum centenum]ACJ00636.1 hypothetical protein RC1_3274 [Rhodospirillum centenum SW]